MNKLKVGMISFAHMHAFSYFEHLRGMPDVEITGIADEDGERVQHLVQKYGIPYYADYRQLLAGDADAIIICSENAKHAEITVAAAMAKKHVLCEKPLGLSEEEMRLMIETCRENGVQLMTAFPIRFSPSVVMAKAAVERGEIGDIVAIKGLNRGSMPGGWFVDPIMAGGGAVLDHTVHLADLMIWFTGSKVKQVYAEIGTLFHDLDIDDAGLLNLTFENGVAAVIDTSWSRSRSFPMWGDLTMDIVGTKGVICVDAFSQYNEVFSDIENKTIWEQWGDDMDALLVSDFVRSIRSGAPVSVTGEDGLNAAMVAFTAYESAKKGRPTPVQPEEADQQLCRNREVAK